MKHSSSYQVFGIMQDLQSYISVSCEEQAHVLQFIGDCGYTSFSINQSIIIFKDSVNNICSRNQKDDILIVNHLLGTRY